MIVLIYRAVYTRKNGFVMRGGNLFIKNPKACCQFQSMMRYFLFKIMEILANRVDGVEVSPPKCCLLLRYTSMQQHILDTSPTSISQHRTNFRSCDNLGAENTNASCFYPRISINILDTYLYMYWIHSPNTFQRYLIIERDCFIQIIYSHPVLKFWICWPQLASLSIFFVCNGCCPQTLVKHAFGIRAIFRHLGAYKELPFPQLHSYYRHRQRIRFFMDWPGATAWSTSSASAIDCARPEIMQLMSRTGASTYRHWCFFFWVNNW